MENANSLGDLKVVPTGEAASLLGLRPQTLRKWATYGGPIKPVKWRSLGMAGRRPEAPPAW